MLTFWLAVAALSVLALVAGALLGFAARRFDVDADPVAERINALLPQSQCAQCGYPGCRPYAEAVAGGAPITKCVPGGETVMLKIAAQLSVDPQPMAEVGAARPESWVAWIDESNCIGCTKCIQACPVDAIVGATRAVHTVVSDLCTGCDLCVAPCPTNCIEMRPLTVTPESWKWDLCTIPITVIHRSNMFNLLSAPHKQRLWDFPGGIHPPEMKSQSSGMALRSLPLPDKLIIPLKQHLGPEGELRVTVGDYVLRGQPLSAGSGRTLPVHAPTSGTIAAIMPHRTAHPSGLAELSVILLSDGDDRWVARQPLANFRQCPPAQLLERIHQSGIAGLGGAGFPTAAKLSGGMSGVETLIINGAECEPYITADDRLMQEHAGDIVTGMAVLRHMLQPQRLLLSVEDNKPDAITALKAALRDSPVGDLRVIPTKYPSGGAKQLTKILTGKEVPVGQHSAAIGVAMLNVGTVYAIKRAIIDGEALTERVVTLTGEALARPGNVWARLGTPVSHLLAHAGFSPAAQPIVIMGGPLMGFTLPALEVPVVKISNCLLALSERELTPTEPEQSCIRCSRCADACPVSLLPQQLYWFSRGQEHDKARQHHLFDCIECGACAYVCPSNIPLVQYYRQQKAEIRALDDNARRAAQAKARYEAKLSRREREKQQRLARHQQAAVKLDAATAAVPGALSGPQPANAVTANGSPQDAVAAAIARVKARRLEAQSGAARWSQDCASRRPAGENISNDNVTHIDTATTPANGLTRSPTRDNRKATEAVSQAAGAISTHHASSPEVMNADPRKEAVVAAISPGSTPSGKRPRKPRRETTRPARRHIHHSPPARTIPARQKAEHNLAAATTISSEED